MNLFTCGKCGEEDKEHIEKVILAGYANMLCFSCKAMLWDEIDAIAKRYLATNPESPLRNPPGNPKEEVRDDKRLSISNERTKRTCV